MQSRPRQLSSRRSRHGGVAGISPLEWGAGDAAAPAWGKSFPQPQEPLDDVSSIAYTSDQSLRKNILLKPKKYEVLVFHDRSGKSPYLEWLDTLDWKTQERILNRVARAKQGQFGDFKALDAGLYEMRLFFGPGYRVYFGEHQGKVILLLTGGDKSTQRKDITKAKEFWRIYLEDNA